MKVSILIFITAIFFSCTHNDNSIIGKWSGKFEGSKVEIEFTEKEVSIFYVKHNTTQVTEYTLKNNSIMFEDEILLPSKISVKDEVLKLSPLDKS